MRRHLWLAWLLAAVPSPTLAQEAPRTLVDGLKNPTAVAVGLDGKVYVTTAGEFGKDGDGALLVIDKGKAVTVAKGLDDPSGVAAHLEWLFVADKHRVWRIHRAKGKAEVFFAGDSMPAYLVHITVDRESGLVYVSYAADSQRPGGIYRISPKGKPSVLVDGKQNPAFRTPSGLALDGQSFLLVLSDGELHRVRVTDGKSEKVANGLGSGGLAWDYFGRLFASDGNSGRFHVIPRPNQQPVVLSERVPTAPGIALDPGGRMLLVADPKSGSVVAVRAQVPGAEVNDEPLPLETALAFPKLKWTGWQPETPEGKIAPLRPIVLTHAGDGSNRAFVATQHGVIHVFPNDDKAEKTKVFLDIESKVRYDDKTNEEGFLGLAFHPRYKENGEFFVFYTDRNAKLVNVLSRFRVSKDDPDRADPASEEELLRVERPFWNHDGGTVVFGPDGMLYLALGDGGSANDPFNHAQNLGTLLGSVLRLDVDRKDPGKAYSIPEDNPFVGKKGARPEIWAYGLRNVWRMAFDRKTGKLWAGEVGQNLFEEINILQAGGNYGWKLRESLHPFTPAGVGPRPDLIEPIWEYHHDVGKSITGGAVYRGSQFPELAGHYLYADYVSNKIWALKYDEGKGRVVANRPLKDPGRPVLSFGEDEKGEVYFLTTTTSGRGIYWFVKP